MPRRGAPFSDSAVAKIKRPDSGRVEKFDGLLPGFGVRLDANGTRVWFVLYRLSGVGPRRRYTIGQARPGTLADAREIARGVLRDAAKGIDPHAKRQDAATAAANTYKGVLAEYTAKGTRHRAAGGQKEAKRVLETLVSAWGTRPVGAIERREIIEQRNKLVKAGKVYAAERLVTELRSFFRWTVEEGYRDASPAAVVASPFARGERQARKRTLADDELRSVWKATGEPNDKAVYPFGAFVRFLLLTGVRRNEAAAATWPEVKAPKALWVVPAERTKTKRADHAVPLSPPAVALLAGLPRYAEGLHLFSNTHGKVPISGFSKSKAALDERIAAAREAAGQKPIPPWRLHDLRRTVSTRMQAAGVAAHVRRVVLGHAVEQGVLAVYSRAEFEAEHRAALERWAEQLLLMCLSG